MKNNLHKTIDNPEVDAMSTYEKLSLVLALAGVVIGVLQLLK